MNYADCPLGGKSLILGGDFRQCLPVVPPGTSMQQVSACLISCCLWHHFKKPYLTDNIKAEGDPDFAQWLLQVEDGLNSRIVDVDHHNIDIRHSGGAHLCHVSDCHHPAHSALRQHLCKTVTLA